MRNIFVSHPEHLAALAQFGAVERVEIVTDSGKKFPLGITFFEGNPESAVSPKLLGCWIDAHVPTAQIEEITSLATTVLEDADKAITWLSAANPATDGRAPIELMGEPQGFERVKNLLLRIEYGVLA